MQVPERIDRVLLDQLGPGYSWDRDTPLLDGGLGLDSLDRVELVMRLEEEFAVRIPDDDAEVIETVGDAVDYIEKRLAERPAFNLGG